MHSKDTLPGLKTQKKKPNETKNNDEKKERKQQGTYSSIECCVSSSED